MLEINRFTRNLKYALKTLPCSYQYRKLKRFIENHPEIDLLFPKEEVFKHYGGKIMRNNIFHPDFFISQIRYFRMLDFFRERYPDIFDNATTVLDAGDSSGILFEAMGRKGDSVNIDKDAVERIKGKGLVAFEASIYNLPFKDKSYDYVFSFQCLEHLECPLAGLKELTRVAKKRIFISIPYRENTMIYNKQYWENRVKLSPEKGGWGVSRINENCDFHIFEFSTADFLNLVSFTGFVCKNHFPINYFSRLGHDNRCMKTYFNFFELEPKR